MDKNDFKLKVSIKKNLIHGTAKKTCFEFFLIENVH